MNSSKDKNLFIKACEDGKEVIVKALIDVGIDLDAENEDDVVIF